MTRFDEFWFRFCCFVAFCLFSSGIGAEAAGPAHDHAILAALSLFAFVFFLGTVWSYPRPWR